MFFPLESRTQCLRSLSGKLAKVKVSQVCNNLIVTVKFENPEQKPLNFFVKATTDNPSHKQWIEELKAFKKEARFLVDYVAQVLN